MGKQAAPRKVGDKEALAIGNTIRGSARKLNLVAGLIRGRKVEEALNILKFSPKGMADDVRKVLASAVANAEHRARMSERATVRRAIAQEAAEQAALAQLPELQAHLQQADAEVLPFIDDDYPEIPLARSYAAEGCGLEEARVHKADAALTQPVKP